MGFQITTNITSKENSALSYLPDRLSDEVRKYAALYGAMINEIRLRSGGLLSLTIRGENIATKCIVTEEECSDTFMRLCHNSPYSFSETLREGFITTKEGIRAGICGRAVCENGVITAISGTVAICIRIPRRIPGAGGVAYGLLDELKYRKGIIIWSAPGIGKTTVLRELAMRIASGTDPKRLAIIDTRHELGADISDCGLIDILDGYPRAKGIEIAKRTMSPQVIICDEIATTEDADAILDAAGSGIAIAASAHAGSLDELLSKSYMKPITESGCIGAYAGLLQQLNGGYEYEVFRVAEDHKIIFKR